jgi:hypothetical protein
MVMIQLRELGPNDACFCGSGRKLKKCCKKRGYWVGPNMVVTSGLRGMSGGMELLAAAAENGVRVTVDMDAIAIYKALPAHARALALLDTYCITLPARVYEETNTIVGRMDYVWFLYAQKMSYVTKVHETEGITPEKMQKVAESATKWLWTECGRDGTPPVFASVENMDASLEADPDIDQHIRHAELLLPMLNPSNRPAVMTMWMLGRAIHRAFGALFGEPPVGTDPADCQCDRCTTRPHPKGCNCNWCSALDTADGRTIHVRSDPLPGRGVSSPRPEYFGIQTPTAITRQALDALGRTLVIYSPEASMERLHEAHEATLIGDTQRARVLLNQLRAETDEAIETLKPYADRTYNEGAQVADLIVRFESMREKFVSLTAKVEELEKM